MNFESMLLGLGMPGLMELVIIGFIILLLFGSNKLPTLMRNLGKSTNEFKKGMNETLDDESSNRDGKA
jgi:sec-independent protein translocase protein TatA